MVTWKVINEEYTDYLRNNYEPRIPHTDYGIDKLKPFFGELFRVDNLVYVTQVTSPKPRHNTLKESIDFRKIFKDNKLISCVNLNYMFPVPDSELMDMQYKDIDKYVSFSSENKKSKYIQLLKYELTVINNLSLEQDSIDLYNRKYDKPNDAVSLRCFDFKALEIAAQKWADGEADNGKVLAASASTT